jgi:hypothetical protein
VFSGYAKSWVAAMSTRSQPGVLADVGRKSGILADIQQLLLENKNRDQHIGALRAVVNGLVDVVHEDVRQNAEARNAMSKSLSSTS